MLYLCKVLWFMELVCDVCPLGGLCCEFWHHSIFTLCHYALYCTADCSSRRFLSPLVMVKMFPIGCMCVVVYPDTQIHTGTQLEKSSPSPKSTKIRVLRIFPGGCRCVMVYPDKPIHTNIHRHPTGKILTIPKVDKNPRELQSAIQDSA